MSSIPVKLMAKTSLQTINGGFLWVLRFPPPIKLTTMIYLTEILLKVAINNRTLTIRLLLVYYILYVIQLSDRVYNVTFPA
jgi:hypothetical protein